jgi:hypothetical protein
VDEARVDPGVAAALGLGVALGLDDDPGAWMHHEDFVISEVIPSFAASASARLG